MSIRNMHYDFKKKLNKVDSQQYQNLLIPEIDWVLNEAQSVFIDNIVEPRIPNYLGFEKNQKSIDDIRAIVKRDNSLSTSKQGDYYLATLPNDYRYYISGEVKIKKGNCTKNKVRITVRQHDDMFEDSPFDKSSFEWSCVNAVFTDNKIKLFTDDSFTIEEVILDYIREPKYMHNAADYRNGTYTLPDGTILGINPTRQDCELPKHTHREIVDIAVLITTGEIQAPDYQTKQAKIQFNHLMQ